MSDYSPVTVFVAKDSLSIGDPLKKVVGSELDAEFDAIATAISSKMDADTAGGANGVAELNAQSRVFPLQLWAQMATLFSDAGALDIPCESSNSFYAVLTENTTIGAPTDAVDGQTITIVLQQDGTGSWTVTWNAIWCFPGGSAPTMTAAANKADLYEATYNATLTKWLVRAHQNYTVA